LAQPYFLAKPYPLEDGAALSSLDPLGPLEDLAQPYFGAALSLLDPVGTLSCILRWRLGRNTRRRNRVELKEGSAAPDFTLASHTDQKVSLASFKGRPVVVAFLPFAFTGG
jgi:hypothetical protein